MNIAFDIAFALMGVPAVFGDSKMWRFLGVVCIAINMILLGMHLP